MNSTPSPNSDLVIVSMNPNNRADFVRVPAICDEDGSVRVVRKDGTLGLHRTMTLGFNRSEACLLVSADDKRLSTNAFSAGDFQ